MSKKKRVKNTITLPFPPDWQEIKEGMDFIIDETMDALVAYAYYADQDHWPEIANRVMFAAHNWDNPEVQELIKRIERDLKKEVAENRAFGKTN